MYRARTDLFEGKNVYAAAYDGCSRGMEDSAPIFGGRHETDSYCDGFKAAELAVVANTKEEEMACCGEDSDSQESSLVTDELLESSDNEVFVPQTVQVDGRKREAKRLKSRTKIAQEELELEKLVRDY